MKYAQAILFFGLFLLLSALPAGAADSTLAPSPAPSHAKETSETKDPDQEDDQTIHQLSPVVVNDTQTQFGMQSISGEALRTIPNATGSVTGALKAMSNIQYSNMEQSDQEGGEIAPPRISIYGAKPYENNFMVDGMSVTNTLNPTGLGDLGTRNEKNSVLMVGGGDYNIFYDTDLLESIEVYTNNVPAKYGNFTGGVISSTLRAPRTDEWHFSIRGSGTSSTWYNANDIDIHSEDSSAQPKYHIWNGAITVEGPISETAGVLFSYNRTESTIPLYYRENYDTEPYERNQSRISQNFFAKIHFQPTDNFSLSADASYAPYEAFEFSNMYVDSDRTTKNEALRGSLQADYSTEIGDFAAKFQYMKSGFNLDSQSNEYIVDKDSTGAFILSQGGFGDRESDQTVFDFGLDYTTPTLTFSDLSAKLETGFDVNYTQLDVYAENVTWSQKVAGPPTSIFIYQEYDEFDRSDDLTTFAFYAQMELEYKRLTFSPGIRIDYDEFTSNLDIAPRLQATLDVFDNNMLRLNGGYNRYYGNALRSYAFGRFRPGKQYLEMSMAGVPTPILSQYSIFTDNQYNVSGLNTPYSDEYTVGIDGTVWDTEYSIEYTHRRHKNQLVSKKVGQQEYSIFWMGDERTAQQDLYDLTNDGESQYDGVTLALGRNFELGAFGNHFVSFGATISTTKTFNGSYGSDISSYQSGAYMYNYDQVYYDGALTNRSDLPADDYNAPLTLTLTLQSSFWDDRLRLNWVNRWRDSSEGLLLDKRNSNETPYGTVNGYDDSSSWITPNGLEYVTAYEYGNIKGGITSDINVEFDVIKKEDFTFGLSLDVFNIFNTNVGVSATEEGTASATSKGRSFWLGFYATY